MTAGFHEDALHFRDLVRDVLGDECSSTRLRADLDGTSDPRARWKTLADLGLFALTVSEELGGLGVEPSTMALIAEELGYAALPEPVIETTCVVAPLLARHAPADLRDAWLPRLIAGEVIATVQLDGASAAPFGQHADVAIVGGADGLRLVDLAASPPVAVTSDDVVRRPARITGDGVPLSNDPGALAEAQTRGTTFTAAVLNGASRRLVAMSVEYALDREQFGVPIGSFQAVKHLLAEAHTGVESSRPAAWYAARVADGDAREAAIAASVAKLTANRAAKRASWHALQVHGGIGFTWEHDLQFWLKRVRGLEEQWGSTRDHRRALGRAALHAADLVDAFGPRLPA
jgi:alkylation response protein AidB-like acyl-CoA dehydrogenase